MPFSNNPDNPISLEEVFEQLPEHVYWKNKEGIYLGCNSANWQDFNLQSLRDVIGKTDYEIFPKEEADPLRKIDLEVMHTGKAQIVEEGDLKKLYLSHKAPLRDKNNNIIGVIGTSVNITDAKKAEIERIAEITEAKIKANAEKEIRQAVTILSGSIAHDLRTPLCSINIIASTIRDFLPALLQGYQLAQNAGLNVSPIQNYQLEYLQEIHKELQEIAKEMNQFIDVSLKALTHSIEGIFTSHDLVPCNSWKYISRILQDYPFQDGQRELIVYDQSYHFTFMGNPILFIRILTNLMKNALHQIQKTQKGQIFIHAETKGGLNTVHFRDTAAGASPEIIACIFDGYQSHSAGGTGIGLASSKLAMQSMGGDITCHSVEGEYIEFVLSFPQIPETDK